MNRVFNIVLLILGIMALAFPPLGLIVLTVLFISWRVNKARGAKTYRIAYDIAYTKYDRESVLAYKGLG